MLIVARQLESDESLTLQECDLTAGGVSYMPVPGSNPTVATLLSVYKQLASTFML